MKQDLANVALVMDQAGALHGVFVRSQKALQRCAQNQALWYALIRTAELGYGELPTRIENTELASPTAAAQQAVMRNPASPSIKTVAARLLNSESEARAALALDPGYAPASMALAAIQLAGGDPASALQSLAAPKVEALPGAHTLRAKAWLAQARFNDAIAESKRDLKGGFDDAPEPYDMQLIRRDAEETLGLALRAAKREKEGAAHLRTAAALGSKTAEVALREH